MPDSQDFFFKSYAIKDLQKILKCLIRFLKIQKLKPNQSNCFIMKFILVVSDSEYIFFFLKTWLSDRRTKKKLQRKKKLQTDFYKYFFFQTVLLCLLAVAFVQAAPAHDETIVGQVGNSEAATNPQDDQEGIRRLLFWGLLLG